jgi:hypothetical protein
MARGYWNSVLHKRVNRRRAIAGAGAMTAGAAFLAACGSGDDGPQAPEDKSGLLYDREDETKSAKKGGLYTDAHPLVLRTMDPMVRSG